MSNDKVAATFHPQGPDAAVLTLVLRKNGLDDNGASPHSWRCEHPDRYPGYCTCVADIVADILEEGFHR